MSGPQGARVARRSARLLLSFALVAAALSIPREAYAEEATNGGWTTNATAPANATPDTAVTIDAIVTAAAGRRAVVDVEVYGPDGRKVAQQFWDRVTFEAGERRTFQWTWQVPAGASPGVYVVKVGIFNAGWGRLWHWNNNAARVTVSPTPPTTTTTTTTAPTTTSTVPTSTTTSTTTAPTSTTTPPITTTTTTTTVAPSSTTSTTTTAPPTSTTPPPTTMPDHDHGHVVCPGERDETPLGALPPALPMLCDHLGPAVDTAVRGANSWADDFDHGTSMGELPASYVEGTVNDSGVSRHFIHNNHWMVDIRSDSGQYPTLLAAWMRPAQTFKPKPDGSVVIEFEVASPIAGTRDAPGISDSWPEFAITTAPAPTGPYSWFSHFLKNGTYFYEAFSGANVMGCRIQQSRHPICAFYRPDSDTAGSPDRLWEINQNGTDVVPGTEFGGDPTTPGLDSAWATCSNTDDPDTVCRNTFRVTLTTDHIRFDVKKPGGSYVRYYEATPCNDRAGCETGQMGRILNNPAGLYVYFADFAYRIENDEVIRFHWDHLAVNP